MLACKLRIIHSGMHCYRDPGGGDFYSQMATEVVDEFDMSSDEEVRGRNLQIKIDSYIPTNIRAPILHHQLLSISIFYAIKLRRSPYQKRIPKDLQTPWMWTIWMPISLGQSTRRRAQAAVVLNQRLLMRVNQPRE